MQIANSPTREKFPLSPKKITKKTCLGSCGCLFVLLFFFLLGGFSLSSEVNGKSYWGILTIIFLVLFALSVLINYFYQKWYFNVYYYDLGEDYIVIRKGPITPKEITIPYERVQDVYMDQDIIDRIMGLYDVHLSSATFSSGMEAHIDGLERTAADGLKQVLLQTVSSKINRHRGQNNALPPSNDVLSDKEPDVTKPADK